MIGSWAGSASDQQVASESDPDLQRTLQSPDLDRMRMEKSVGTQGKIIYLISHTNGLKIPPTSVFFALLLRSFLWPLLPNIIKPLEKHKKVDTVHNRH